MYPAEGSLFPLLLPGQVTLVKFGFSRLNEGDSPMGVIVDCGVMGWGSLKKGPVRSQRPAALA